MKTELGEQAIEILKTIAACGEYPTGAIDLIRHNNKKYLYQVIHDLRENRYISETGKSTYKSLRLLEKGINTVLSIDVRLKKQYDYMTYNQQYSGNPVNKIRILKVSETVQLMNLAAVRTLPWEKPLVERNSSNDYTNSFYLSREVKNNGIDKLLKVSYSRAVGIFITLTGQYSVYNFENNMGQWSTRGELKWRDVLDKLTNACGWGKDFDSKHNSIILLKNPTIAVKILFNNYHEDNDVKPINLNGVYDAMYYVPISNDGVQMLKILAAPYFTERIRKATLPEQILLDSKSSIIADGMDSNHKFYYLFFNSDLRRFRDFRNSMVGNNIPPEQWIVYCFPWQKDIVMAYLGSEAQICIYDMSVIEKAIGLYWAANE